MPSLNVRGGLAIRSEYFGNLANFRLHIRKLFENDYGLNRVKRDDAPLAVQKLMEARGVRLEVEHGDTGPLSASIKVI